MTCLLAEFCEQKNRVARHIFVKSRAGTTRDAVARSSKSKSIFARSRGRVPTRTHPTILNYQSTNMAGYDPINKMYTVEQHRLADYFEHQQTFYPFSTWPAWLQDVALTCPKSFQQRTSMFFHLVRNNLFAPTARTWVLSCNVIDGKLIWSDAYDESVKMDMARLVKKAIAGEIVDEHAATYAHHLGRVVKGLNPGSCPANPEQLAELAKPSGSLRSAKVGPKRTRPQPTPTPTKVPGLRYEPVQAKPYERLRSSVEYYKRGGFYVTHYAGKTHRLFRQ